MQNFNINKIEERTFPKQPGILQAVHRDKFICFLLKHEDATQSQPTFSIKRVDYDDVDNPKELPLDLSVSDQITTNLIYIDSLYDMFFATESAVYFIDFDRMEVTKDPLRSRENTSIVAAEWNTAEDLLAVVLADHRVFCDYLCADMRGWSEEAPSKVKKNVYLGWGDVRKQFKGKAVAYLKESHPPESSYKQEENNATVSWQYGDRYFVVNAKTVTSHNIRVFKSTCKLYHTITDVKVPGMTTHTIFRAKHNTLATICRGNNGESYVVMHEKNGEYYNTIHPYTSTIDKVNIVDIQFSTCGRIFTILSYTETNYFIDFYTQSNFVWLHKFRLTGNINNKPLSYKFNTTIGGTYPLEIITTESVIIYHFIKTLTTDNSHRVYVNTANNLQVFDYKHKVIPPCGIQNNILSTNDVINYIAVQNNKEKTTLVMITSTEIAYVYQKTTENKIWVEINKINLKHHLESTSPTCFYKFMLTTIENSEYLIAVAYCDKENCFKIKIQLLTGETTIEKVANIVNLHKLNDSVHAINENQYKTSIISACTYLTSTKEPMRYVLTQNGDLYMNSDVVIDGITSLMSYRTYLLVTKTSFDGPMDKLYCFDMSTNRQNKIKDDPSEFMKELFVRPVEKAAILICNASIDGAVILEMPRGNVETITVRPIVLRSVYAKIVDGEFLDAYHLVRRLAMKLNVLYDLAPEKFILNVSTFVQSLGGDEAVIKFILPLKNFSTLMKDDFYFVEDFTVVDKKNKICDALLKYYRYFEVRDNQNKAKRDEIEVNHNENVNLRLICLILLVKHDYDSLEALKFLADYFGGVYTQFDMLQLAEVVTTLKIYTDPQAMYRQALRLYDVELVASIAQVAGMDPQIYRQLLKTCRDSDEVNKRFLMANEGCNYKMAGLYLLILHRKQEKTMDDVINYAKDKNIVEDVFRGMYKSDGEVMLRLAELLIQKYLSEKLYLKAAEVLCRIGNENRAIEVMLSTAECWKEAVTLISMAELSLEVKRGYFNKLAEVCVSHGRFKEAACIYLQKCGGVEDVSKAVDCCLRGLLFVEVVAILRTQGSACDVSKEDMEIYCDRLKEKLMKNLGNVKANLAASSKKFEMHSERLRAVREYRKHRTECGIDGDDAFSESGSATTRSHSSYASTTTRRNKKLAMKLRSLRQGGKFEDIALMRELYDIIADVYNMATDLVRLRTIYTEYAHVDIADVLNEFETLQKKIVLAADEIWLSEYAILGDDVLTADFLTENIVYLDQQYRCKPVCLNA